jgi:HlyD family secretion protein
MKNFPAKTVFICVCLLLSACSNETIPPGSLAGDTRTTAPPAHEGVVEQADIARVYEAVGTIRPLTESVIESQISAQILSVFHTPGKPVKKGELLVELDARRLQSQLKQARESVSGAEKQLAQTRKSINEAQAGLEQATAQYDRAKKLFDSGIVPSQKLEIDKSAYLQATARLEKAKEAEAAAQSAIRQMQEAQKETKIALGYARITSPDDGVVAERMADPGDLAVPGKPLLIIQTSGALRLEAHVREGLISRIKVGQNYPVAISTLNKTIDSVIEEIVPYADPATRTFLVKASLPTTPGIYPGMFGRLMIPVQTENTLLIPEQAVRRIGQLEMIYVKQNNAWQSVYIKTGRTRDGKTEVLAGLTGNETIGYND